MIRLFTVANLIRYRATRQGVQREFDTADQAREWLAA